MTNNRFALFFSFAVAVSLIFLSCSRPAEDVEVTETVESITAPAMKSAVNPPADTTAGAGQEKPEITYEGEVVVTKFLGRAEIKGIKSKYSCKTDEDCTATKFANIPKDKSECTCQAPCTPYVVDVTEEKKRKAANEKFCGPSDWFHLKCPAPQCRFYKFAFFKCHENICYGAAGAPRQ